MNSASRKFVHDIVAEGLNLPKSKVIWYMPNAPRPQKPYATLECFAEVGEAQEDIVKTPTTGVYNFVVPVSATLRVDGSSRFGSDSRYGFFPSVSLGWRFSAEDFLKEASWLTEGKLRLSAGQTGNQSVGNYTWLGEYATLLRQG